MGFYVSDHISECLGAREWLWFSFRQQEWESQFGSVNFSEHQVAFDPDEVETEITDWKGRTGSDVDYFTVSPDGAWFPSEYEAYLFDDEPRLHRKMLNEAWEAGRLHSFRIGAGLISVADSFEEWYNQRTHVKETI